ncbi:hypothetical protein VNI00_005433 [Paramarasmius palmivorus]|uniref:DUF6589 domain-containing protein n=1 Tax=Paramarasmius palmivorus TaxID=297713 RepID=A0AAW0DDJ2_9AGAR
MIFERSPVSFDKFIEGEFMQKKLQKEGQAIQAIFSRRKGSSIHSVLDDFNMKSFEEKLKDAAPILWSMLSDVAQAKEEPELSREESSRRSKELVFVCICAMISVVRSQKANTFQVVIGLFLLGSGASKREIDVLAHAGLSVSYPTVMDHVKALSVENMKIVQEVIKVIMCFLVWDNVNFAFRVESQRLESKDHFDSGTTATLIALYDPYTNKNAEHGTLPLSMKPPRTSMKEIIDEEELHLLPSPEDMVNLEQCCLWQLKQIALQHKSELAHLKKDFAPSPPVETEQIAVHQTEQYPLPAMHEDESTIDGTLKVIETLMEKVGLTEEEIEKHGLVFADGDLLSGSLENTGESARRNSKKLVLGLFALIRRFGLFHCKMAGARMVHNEHWGTPNSKWSGTLWWENNTLLERKSVAAGWQSKKATPWKQSHELIQISLAGHILDGFRIHCGANDFDSWAKTATMEQFDAVADAVYSNLFTSQAYATQHARPDHDTVFTNNILYNRDALFYWLFVTSIKAGNIGRVILVLRVWMVMMRTPKTMPRYADAIFETLKRIEKYPEQLRKFFLHNWLVNLTGRANGFKEVDLLQEHQNFWLKIIYRAKGPNRSWEWLSMISVCIYTLRQALLSVAKMFDIPVYGSKHTIPDMTREIKRIADALEAEKIQEHVPDRLANEFVKPVRDLLAEGFKYDEKRTAFAKYRDDGGVVVNLGAEGDAVAAVRGDDEEEEVDLEYEPTPEDLALDDEEPYDLHADLLNLAESMIADDF